MSKTVIIAKCRLLRGIDLIKEKNSEAFKSYFEASQEAELAVYKID